MSKRKTKNFIYLLLKKCHHLSNQSKSILLIAFLVVSIFAIKQVIVRKPDISLVASTTPKLSFNQSLMLDNSGFNDTYFAAQAVNVSSNPFAVDVRLNIPEPSSVKTFKQYPIVIHTKNTTPNTDSTLSYLYQLVVNFYENDKTSYLPSFTAYIANDKDLPQANNFVTVNSTSPLKVGEWNHISVSSYSEGDYCKLKLFQNGLLVATATSTYHKKCQISTKLPKELIIGKPIRPVSDPIQYLSGEIDELRISNSQRYISDFKSPIREYELDATTRSLHHFNGTVKDEVSGSAIGKIYGTHFSFSKYTDPACVKPPTCTRLYCPKRPDVIYCPSNSAL